MFCGDTVTKVYSFQFKVTGPLSMNHHSGFSEHADARSANACGTTHVLLACKTVKSGLQAVKETETENVVCA